MLSTRFVAVLAVCLVVGAACSRDLGLPDQQRGLIRGSVDASGRLEPGALPVVLVKPTGAREFTSTAADGTFVFDDLAPGQYTVKLELPGFAPLSEPAAVLSGQATELPALKPVWVAGADGVVRGVVLPPMGVTGVAGATVEFRKMGATQATALSAVGFDGQFIARLPAGSYRVLASHPSFMSDSLPDVEVGAGADTTLSKSLQLGLDPATISGVALAEVDGAQPAPIDDTFVTVEPFGATTRANPATGEYTLGGLPPGDYRLRIEHTGHELVGGPLAVTLVRAQSLDAGVALLSLDRGTITGTVMMGDGLTSDGVSVTLTGTGYGAVVAPSAANPAVGSFRISGVPAGAAKEVVARKNGYVQTARGGITVTRNATVDVGQLQLAVQQGQFEIDDGDAAVASGFTRRRDVTVNVTNAPGAVRLRVSEDPAFTGVAFAPFTAMPVAFQLSDADGLHQVYAQYEDAQGVRSPTLSASVLLDRVAPAGTVLSIQSGAGFTSQTQLLALSLEATEGQVNGPPASGLAWMRISASSATDANGLLQSAPVPYQRDSVFVRPVTTDGVQSISVQLVDRAGNAGAVVTRTIVVDSQPPSGSLAIQPGERAAVPGYTDSATVTLSLTAAAEPSGGFVLMRLANSQQGLDTAPLQPFSSPVTWPLGSNTEGLRTVYLRLVDAAGNVASDQQASITLDRTPPTPATATLVGPSITNAAQVTLTLGTDTASLPPDGGVTVSESLLFAGAGTQGPMGFPASSQVTVPVTAPDGPKTYYVRFRDRAGNDAIAEVRLTRDTEPPTGSVSVRGTKGDGSFSSEFTNNANLSVAITHSGAQEYQLLTTGTSCPASGWLPLPTGRVTVPLASPGTYTLRLCLRDAALNVAGPFAADPIVYDVTPPSSCSLSLVGSRVGGGAAPAGKTGQRTVTASLPGATACSETPAELVLSTNPSLSCTNTAPLDWVPYTASSAFFLPGADGPTVVRGCVRDAAGNVGPVTQATITLDTTPPQAPQVQIAGGAAWLNAATGVTAAVTGTATDGPVEWGAVESPALPTAFVPYGQAINLTFSGPSTSRTVNALFRDDVGNVSAVASDGVLVDLSAPTATMSVRTPSGNAFTNSVSVDVSFDAASADVTELFLVRGGAGACSNADFTSAVATPFTRTSTFLLASGDGLKRVCARLRDAAGNQSAILESTVTLDTVPPGEPRITTLPQVLNRANGTPFVVNIEAAVTEPFFARYEGLGGSFPSWTELTQVRTTTAFTFNLVSTSNPTGFPNTLRLRAVDLAGNVSPESAVTITTDIVKPPAVTISRFGVDNRSDEATLYWTPSSVGDLAGYRIYYGRGNNGWIPTADGGTGYSGTFAVQGVSPLFVPQNVTSTTLSGLTNGTLAYASVRAVDLAGNESDFPADPQEVELQPNAISPSVIAQLSLSPMSTAQKIVVQGDRALVVGLACSPTLFAATHVAVAEVMLGGLSSRWQGGTLGAGVPPTLVGVSTFAVPAGNACNSPVDLVVDGAMAYLTVGPVVSVHRLLGSGRPTLANQVASANVGGWVSALALDGPRLFATRTASSPATLTFDLATFFDNVAGHSLTLVGSTAAPGSVDTPSGILSTRNRLISIASNSNAFALWNNAPAYGAPSAPATFMSMVLNTTGFFSVGGALQNGNLLYVPSYGGLTVRSLVNAWGGAGNWPEVASSVLGESRRLDLQGEILWAPERDTRVLRMLGTTSLLGGDIEPIGTFSPGGLDLNASEGLQATAAWGNYQLVASGGYAATAISTLQVLEVANPTALRVVSRPGTVGVAAELHGGFLVTAQPSIVDLHSGTTPFDRGNFAAGTGFWCNDYGGVVDAVLVGERLVQATTTGPNVAVLNLESPLGRMGIPTRAMSYGFNVGPAGTRVLALERFGNFLVLLEDRQASGVFLEVLDLSPVLDHDETAGTQLSAANTRGAVRLGAYVSPSDLGTFLMGDVKVVNGRAVVGIDQFSDNHPDPAQGLFVVDLRGSLDDNPVTAGPVVLGALPAEGVRKVEVNGTLAWVSGDANFTNALEAWDIGPALQEPAQPLTATTFVGRALLPQHPEGLVVRGGWAFVSTAVNTSIEPGIYVYDISRPSSPRQVGYLRETSGNSTCASLVPLANSLTLSGNRLVLANPSGMSFIDLE